MFWYSLAINNNFFLDMAKKQKEIERYATHQGEFSVGDFKIPVAVLDNKERVVSIRGIATVLGVKGGGSYWKEKKANPDKEMLPEFISAKNIEEYTKEILPELIMGTREYRAVKGQEAEGIKSEILPKICDLWIKALSGGILTEKQKKVAQQARILLGAFATVGINALIDEVTGFQKEKDEYQKILQRYLATELQPWLKKFGDDYYGQIYRLKGWDWNRFLVDRKNHPWSVANITNRIVYEKLPDGVLEALNELEPKNRHGNRIHRLHQHLSPDEGQVHLLKHLGAIVNIMERYKDGEWELALQEIDRRFPSKRVGVQKTLDFPIADKNAFENIIGRASKQAEEVQKKVD
jgi:hypothetical protein